MDDYNIAISKVKDLFSLCNETKPQEIDLNEIEEWETILIKAMLVLRQKGDTYNFMKTIKESYLSFAQSLPNNSEYLMRSTRPDYSDHLDIFVNKYEDLKKLFKKLKFNFEFYQQLGYFNNNIVAVGANGSGKTSLADSLRENLNQNGLVISAQRVLFIPELEQIPMPKVAETKWQSMNTRSRTFKDTEDFLEIKEEFGYVIGNLLAKHCNHSIDFLNSSKLNILEKPLMPSSSELEDTLNIWNDIFDHRKLVLKDGISLQVCLNESEFYEPIKMSEGEKSALYLISQIVQAPKEGFIIIDEPEMYLHKTIISKLWDKLESFRSDCIFIYLTHDLDFAVSRITATKVWLKSFTYPSDWDIKAIPENVIPEKLMLELLGSRKNVLFCEGEKGSIDQRIYSVLLPNYTIIPVNGCRNVINFTKAFNKIPNVNIQAFGLIDADHHAYERLQSLIKHNVYSLKLAEVENIFLYEDFLVKMVEYLFIDNSKIQVLKTDILSQLSEQQEMQASRYVSTLINNYFNESHVSKGNSLKDVDKNFKEFYQKIDIEKWYQERISLIGTIINEKDYEGAISIFNNKGLQSIAARCLNKSDFTEFALNFLNNNPDVKQILRKSLPKDLLQVNV